MSENLSNVYHALVAEDLSAPSHLLARICVRPPYFALQNIHLENQVLSAQARAELPRGLALGPMRPGELSRHGAIAGLCAVAMQQRDEQQRYYLATRAAFVGFPSDAPYGAVLEFKAEVADFGKRTASAFVTAFYQDEKIATLEVEYTVLSKTVFERLHAFRRQPTYATSFKPVPITTVEWRDNTGTSVIPVLPVEMCAGHFDNYPATPVALLMDQLAQIAERFVERPSYIARGEIEATRLCWAGDAIKLSMTKLSGDLRKTHLHGFIESGGERAGEITLWLQHELSS